MKLKKIVDIIYKNTDWYFFIRKPYLTDPEFSYFLEISSLALPLLLPRTQFITTKESKLFEFIVKKIIRREQNKMIFGTLNFLSWCLHFNLGLTKIGKLTFEHFFNLSSSLTRINEAIPLSFTKPVSFTQPYPDTSSYKFSAFYYLLYQNFYRFIIFLVVTKIFKLKKNES